MHAADRNHHLTVTVAALTRDRPQMLRALLDSWGTMDLPQDVTVILLVVENAKVEASRALVEGHVCANGLTVRYRLETELGIPFARNCAAKAALEFGSDLIAFVDDDEEVAKDWLARLVAGYRGSSAVLLGAPLRMRRLPADSLTLSQRLMQRSLEARYLRKEKRAARLAGLNDTPRVTIVTNNWLAETRLFSEYGLWFDEKMRFTGGTDAKFYAETKRRGLPTGWVADAHVYETVPADRLTFRYQFRRGRDQSNTHFRRKHGAIRFMDLSDWLKLVVLSASLVFLLLSLPLTRGRTYVDLARTAGWIIGRITALMGRQSRLYSKVTGS